MTQSQTILKYLMLCEGWVPGYQLTSVNTQFGFISHQGGRTCRKLAEGDNPKIERKMVGRFVYYRLIPKSIKIYKVEGRNEEIKVNSEE